MAGSATEQGDGRDLGREPVTATERGRLLLFAREFVCTSCHRTWNAPAALHCPVCFCPFITPGPGRAVPIESR